MKSFKILSAMFATFLMLSTANAVEITIDDFSTAQGPIGDLVVGGGAVTDLIALAGLPKTINRTLSTELLASASPVQNSVEVTGGAGGILDVTNGTGEDSQVKVIWTLQSNIFLGPVQNAGFRFTVVDSDGNPTNIGLAMGGTSLGNFAIPGNTQNQILNFALDDLAKVATVNLGGPLTLTIDGAPGWDLSLNQLSLTFNEVPGGQVPEPGTISLLGLGLLGLGWSRWRRSRSAE